MALRQWACSLLALGNGASTSLFHSFRLPPFLEAWDHLIDPEY